LQSSEAIWSRAARYGRFEGSSPYRDKDGSIRVKLKVSFIYQAPGDARPIRHRESTGLDDSRDNRRKWKACLEELERELIRARLGSAESLDLRCWFPRSRTLPKVMFSQAATVEAFARRYLDELVGAGIGAQTLEQYHHIFRAHIFGSDLAGVPLRELNDGHIKLWLGRLQEKTVGAKERPLQLFSHLRFLADLRAGRRRRTTAMRFRVCREISSQVRALVVPHPSDVLGSESGPGIFGAIRRDPVREPYTVDELRGVAPHDQSNRSCGSRDLVLNAGSAFH
jgi:hypothetical protein